MTGPFSNKKRILSAVLTVVFAISICAVAVCIIAAAPRDSYFEPEFSASTSSDNVRITAPTATEDASLPDSEPAMEDDTQITSPEQEPESEDSAIIPSETSAPVAVQPDEPEETTALPKVEITLDESLFEEIVLTPPKEGPIYVLPELKDCLLVDELSIVHTIQTPAILLTEEELVLAATVIQLEVMGDGSSLYRFDDISQKYWEMCAVAQVIRNRAESARFPNSISGVILQSTTLPSGRVIYQFSPADKLANFTPTEEALVAAREVFVDGVTVLPSNYYYFCATRIEASFEKNNAYMFSLKSDGSLDKIRGHLTTFYAGHK